MDNNIQVWRDLSVIGHPKHIKQIVSHPELAFRQDLARNGSDEIRDHLIKDLSHHVRYYVALLGTRNQANQLIHDEVRSVRDAAWSRLFWATS